MSEDSPTNGTGRGAPATSGDAAGSSAADGANGGTGPAAPGAEGVAGGEPRHGARVQAELARAEAERIAMQISARSMSTVRRSVGSPTLFAIVYTPIATISTENRTVPER